MTTGSYKTIGQARTIRELLGNKKYSLDYYQREYKWQTKHIVELLDDLESKFYPNYSEDHERKRVQQYPHYFLGSVIISSKDGKNNIIDGQQRLTTLTLLFMYLNRLLKSQDIKYEEDLSRYIYSHSYGEYSFNIDVPERQAVLKEIYDGGSLDISTQPEPVRNIKARYNDIEGNFPENLKDKVLPYFIDWILDNVELIEITPSCNEDAYTIFETMNDRGLVLSPTDMLKGYLLSNIELKDDTERVNSIWKKQIYELIKIGKEEETDFFKAWLRAKYAKEIRERKKNATNKDFEDIHNAFHKWVRDHKDIIGLNKSSDFVEFMEKKFIKFSEQYIRLCRASENLLPDYEYVYYNALNEFTLQYPLALAPLKSEDEQEAIDKKIKLVTGYIDIFVARRIVNFRTLGYSSIVYSMFNLMKEIRDLEVKELASILRDKVNTMEETFDGFSEFYLHQQNKRLVHHLLARITHHIENQSGYVTSFESYISREIANPFEIEHIWANRYKEHNHDKEFTTENEFAQFRNRIGDLLLLPKNFNQSYSDNPYSKKVDHYFGQNLLAKSLNDKCYTNNPGFQSYLERSGLPFKPYLEFTKENIDERQKLYENICKEIWNPSRLDVV